MYYKYYGGDEENRTPDPLLARQVLSHLSYTPITVFRESRLCLFVFCKKTLSFIYL